jgi:hypothetical protein
MLILREYDSLASMEANDEKADALSRQVLGEDDTKRMQGYDNRSKIRQVLANQEHARNDHEVRNPRGTVLRRPFLPWPRNQWIGSKAMTNALMLFTVTMQSQALWV